MKYIKEYESSEYNGKYWLLPTDSRFAKSLKDIQCALLDKKNFLKNNNIHKYSYVFIIYENDNALLMNGWGWNPYKGKITDDYSENKKLEFCGLINMNVDQDMELISQKISIQYNL